MSGKVLSFNDYVATPDVNVTTVDVGDGITVRLGAVSSADIIEWFEENDDPIKKRFAGLRLLIKCWINEDDTRIGDGLEGEELTKAREKAVQAISRRPGAAQVNGKLVKAALEVNGLKPKDGGASDAKNG